MENVNSFQCNHIGVATDGVKLEEIHNNMGQHYWKATTTELYIFGYKVDGELVGIGETKEEALKRLEIEKQSLAESLWE
jgi:hypothetical protein